MNKHTLATSVGTLATLALATPVFALPIGAQARLDAQAQVGADATTTRAQIRAEAQAQVMGQREEQAKQRAYNEIERRIRVLTELAARVGDMLHVSDSGKTSVNATVQAQIAALTDLRARIEADDATSTLKADMQSITKSYRIFALIIPQGHIQVSADRIHSAADAMTALLAKLSTRLSDAASAGTDVSAEQSLVTSAQGHIADATTAADAAVSLTANLQPDNGDETVAAANKQALKDGRAKIQEALKALQGARTDINALVSGVKKLNASASTESQTDVSTQ